MDFIYCQVSQLFSCIVYSYQVMILFSLLKKLISVIVFCLSIEKWIKLVNLMPGISLDLRNKLILYPRDTENVRHLEYLELNYYSNIDDSLNKLARINFETWESRSRQVFFKLSKSADLKLDIAVV